MRSRYSTYQWEVYSDGAFDKHERRRIFIELFKFHKDDGGEEKNWEVWEEWKVLTGREFKTCFGMMPEYETHRVSMLAFDSYEEANLFIILLIEVLSTSGENETCKMLSRYVWEKLVQADPEKLYRLHEEEEAYQQKIKEEREAARALAALKKRNEKNPPCHVYVFSFGERFCKIGISTNVEARRRTKISDTGRPILQWGYSELFPYGNALEIEKTCHRHFGAFRTYGEFFEITFDEACSYLQSQVKNPLVICREEKR